MTGISRPRIDRRGPFTATGPARTLRALTLLGSVSLLAGCMYDPYSGTYYLCCGTPYHAYPAYTPYYGGYPYPYAYPPPYYPPPPGYAEPQAATPGNDTALAQRFARANTTHDGRLTQRQAEVANWQIVARNFPQIDIDQKGYVTLPEIRAWLAAQVPPPPGMHG